MKDGGPAFPTPLTGDNETGVVSAGDSEKGMSLRDYFAAKALSTIQLQEGLYQDFSQACEYGAKYAYQIADAMLKEREK